MKHAASVVYIILKVGTNRLLESYIFKILKILYSSYFSNFVNSYKESDLI